MTAWTMVTAAVLLAAVWLVRRKIPLWLKFLVALMAVILVTLAYYAVREAQSLSEGSWFEQSPIREVVFFLIMVAGMAAYAVANAIEARRSKLAVWQVGGEVGARPGIDFDLWEFVYPFLFSVFTFGGLLGQIGDDGLSVATVVIAFQTGFFWQTVFDKVRVRAQAPSS
jgi:hypothetical protein